MDENKVHPCAWITRPSIFLLSPTLAFAFAFPKELDGASLMLLVFLAARRCEQFIAAIHLVRDGRAASWPAVRRYAQFLVSGLYLVHDFLLAAPSLRCVRIGLPSIAIKPVGASVVWLWLWIWSPSQFMWRWWILWYLYCGHRYLGVEQCRGLVWVALNLVDGILTGLSNFGKRFCNLPLELRF